MVLNKDQIAVCRIIQDVTIQGLKFPVPTEPLAKKHGLPISSKLVEMPYMPVLVHELVIWAMLYPESNGLDKCLEKLQSGGFVESFDRQPVALTFLRSDGKTARIVLDDDKDLTVRVFIEGEPECKPGGSLRIVQGLPLHPHWKLTQLGSRSLTSATTDESKTQPAAAKAWQRLKLTEGVSGDHIASLDGIEYRIGLGPAFKLLAKLQEVKGSTIKGETLQGLISERPDKAIKRLPEQLREIIDPPGRARRGYRML